MKSRTTNLRRIVDEAAEELRTSGVPEPLASAEILASELLDIRRGEIPLHRETLSDEQISIYRAMISRRRDREPVQRILGYAYFRNLKLRLSEETLIPRPDTESVVDFALQRIDAMDLRRVLDIGTGSGAIAISLAQERPRLEVDASDISREALGVAAENARSNGASVAFHLADLASGLESLAGSVDIIVSNPSYIESAALKSLEPEVRSWDPTVALDGGRDGLDFYRRILSECAFLLSDYGEIVLEVGDGQAHDVLRLGAEAGYTPEATHEDLSGTIRSVCLSRKSDRELR